MKHLKLQLPVVGREGQEQVTSIVMRMMQTMMTMAVVMMTVLVLVLAVAVAVMGTLSSSGRRYEYQAATRGQGRNDGE